MSDGWAVTPERARVQRHLRVNALVQGALGTVGMLAVAAIAVMAATKVGRPSTYLVLTGLVVSVLLAMTATRRSWKQLKGADSSARYLAVSAGGIQVADTISVTWDQVVTIVGVDTRGSRTGPKARVARAAGLAEVGVYIGLEDGAARALRDAAGASLRRYLQLIGPHGGIWLPLDPILTPSDLHGVLGALPSAAAQAGVDMRVPAQNQVKAELKSAYLLSQRPGSATSAPGDRAQRSLETHPGTDV